MRKGRTPTPADHRRFEQLVWGPGGVYEDYRRNRWQGSIATFSLRRQQEFRALGHRWTLHFCAALYSPSPEVEINLAPKPRLSDNHADRIERTGFYDDLAALLGTWGYRSGAVIKGGMRSSRRIRSARDIRDAQKTFESFDLSRGISAPKASVPPNRQRSFRELMRWGRRSRLQGWDTGGLEVDATRYERRRGVPWRIRCDLLVGLINCCSWFYAWPPKAFRRADWRRVEKTGFFEKATQELQNLGFEGYWRPGLFSDPDRLAAEFWKRTRDPATARRDFDALLRWRLP